MALPDNNQRVSDRTPLGTLLSIYTSFEVLARFLEVELRQHDATLIRFNVMTTLFKNGGTMTPSEIAESVFREKNTITTVIKTLEREGVVRREPSADDRRSVRVVITDKGWKVANRLTPIVQELSREALSCIDREKLESLVEVMRDIRESLMPRLDARTSNSRKQKLNMVAQGSDSATR